MRLCGLVGRYLASLLFEGYGKTAKFDYDNWHNDPTPHVLQLGHWLHPTTGNTLVAGINLNYLSNDQIDALRYNLPDILKDRNLKTRYHSGKRLLPDVFSNFYRTYNRRFINVVEPGSLSFLSPKELDKQGDQERDRKLKQRRTSLAQLKAQKAGIPPEEMPPDEPPEAAPEAPPSGGPGAPGGGAAPGGMGAPGPEAGIPEPPQTPRDRARETVKSQQAQRMISRIDDKLRQRLEAPPIPPPEAANPALPEPPAVIPPPPKEDEDAMPPDEMPDEELPPEEGLPPEELPPEELPPEAPPTARPRR